MVLPGSHGARGTARNCEDCAPSLSTTADGGYGATVCRAKSGRTVWLCEACGLRGVRIEDPARAGEQLNEALSLEGPALIEAVVDPHDMPMTPTINPEHAKGFAWGLARGEPNREQIALRMSRVLAQEMEYASSPAGVLSRAKERVADKLPGSDGSGEREWFYP